VRSGVSLGNHAATANYDGNIARQRFINQVTEPGDVENQAVWTYVYDERNFLSNAIFGAYSASTQTFTASNNYAVQGLTYDANGNILTLQRNDDLGNTMDNFTYGYNSSSPALNRLNTLTETGAFADKGDIRENVNYTYNDIGQLEHADFGTSDGDHYFTYDVTGKVTMVRDDSGPHCHLCL
jgi:hypothetical protein